MKAKRKPWLAACVLIAYSAILIRIVVFKAAPIIRVGHLRLRIAGAHTGSANFVPFETIAAQLTGQGNHFIDMVNLIGNIIPFMPIGLVVPFVARHLSWQKVLVLGIVTGLTFEILEVAFRVGIFDVDDVILNGLGVTLGYGAFVMFKHRRNLA